MNSLNKEHQPCSVIILAAGKSSRMGLPKFGLKFNKELTFLEEIISHYTRFGCQQIIVVLNKTGKEYLVSKSIELPSNCRIVINSHLEWERFYSVKIGLAGLQPKTNAFIHNADNPFVKTKILNGMLQLTSKSNYVVPTYENRGGHPILLSKKIIHDLISEEKNDLILSNFLNSYNKKILEVTDSSILVNINTMKEYNRYFD